MNAAIKLTVIGAIATLATGGIGWASLTLVSTSSDIATIKAVHEVQYQQINEKLKDMKESQDRLEGKLDRYFRRSP